MMAAGVVGVVGDKYFFSLISALSALLQMVDSIFLLRFGIIKPSDLSSVRVLNPSVPRGKLQLSPIVWVASANLGEEFGRALTKIKSLVSSNILQDFLSVQISGQNETFYFSCVSLEVKKSCFDLCDTVQEKYKTVDNVFTLLCHSHRL